MGQWIQNHWSEVFKVILNLCNLLQIILVVVLGLILLPIDDNLSAKLCILCVSCKLCYKTKIIRKLISWIRSN